MGTGPVRAAATAGTTGSGRAGGMTQVGMLSVQGQEALPRARGAGLEPPTDKGLTHGRDRGPEEPGQPGPAVTFVARVHPLGQQHAAQLALGAPLLRHLDQVRRHAERVVADLALVAPPDAGGEGAISGWGRTGGTSLTAAPSPTAGCYLLATPWLAVWMPARWTGQLPGPVVCAPH